MAKRIFTAFNWTPGIVADGVALAASTYMCIWGNSSTQTIDVLEVKITGMASAASAPSPLVLSRCSGTIAATPTALANPGAADGPMHPATAALTAAPQTFTVAATNPMRSSATTDAKLDMGINAYGGLLRWNASPTQQFTVVGNALPNGFALLSAMAFAQSGVISAHMIYEPY